MPPPAIIGRFEHQGLAAIFHPGKNAYGAMNRQAASGLSVLKSGGRP